MKRTRLLQVILPAVLLLAGCKSELTADIALSELSASASYLEAHLSVEVPSCTEPGTDFESSTLLELKSRVPVVFPKATYLGCKDVNLESRASFSIPVLVGRSDAACSGHDICFGQAANHNDAYLVAAGPDFITGYRKLEKVGHYDIETQIRIGLTNDGNAPVDLLATSLYVNDIPMHFETFSVRSARYAELRLSNAAVDAVLAGKSVLIFVCQ